MITHQTIQEGVMYTDDTDIKDLVSIVIPLYNAAAFLREMLDSILTQSYIHWELILVDDGSTDESIKIALEYEHRDSRITLCRRPDSILKGAPSCRNIGMDKAKGEYLIFFDADDYIAPYCLKQRVEYLNSHSEYDFAVFPMLAFEQTPSRCQRNMIWGYQSDDGVLENFIAGTIPFVVATNIYRRRSLLEKQLYWDVHLQSLQDSGFNMASLVSGCSFKISNQRPDYFYRINANSNSVSKNLVTDKHFSSRLYFYEKLYQWFGNDVRYKAPLLVVTNVHFKYLLAGDDREHIRRFLSTSFLTHHVWLGKKLLLCSKLLHLLPWKNRRISRILLLLFCPVFELRYSIWYKRAYHRNRSLADKLMKEEHLC